MSSPNQKQEPLAIASLILACISIMFGPFTGIPAIICGHIAQRRIQKNSELKGSGLASAGLIVGYVILVMSFFVIAVYLFSPAQIQE